MRTFKILYSFDYFVLFSNSVLNQSFQLLSKFWIIFDHCLGSITALCEFGTVIAKPATTLLDDAVLNT